MKRLLSTSLALIGLLLFSASSCDNGSDPDPSPNGKLTIKFVAQNNGQEVNWNNVLQAGGANELRLDILKFYLSNLKAVHANGDTASLVDVILPTFSEPKSLSPSFTIPKGNYESLIVGVGLDALQNSTDPVSVTSDSPLHAAKGMYWSWASKYRFIICEGKADSAGVIGGGDDLSFLYHTGGDEFYSTRVFLKTFTVKSDQNTTLTMAVDIAEFFDGPAGEINVTTDGVTHSEPPYYDLAIDFQENFAAALYLK